VTAIKNRSKKVDDTPEFTTGKRTKPAGKDRVQFRLIGPEGERDPNDVYVIRRPKMTVALPMLALSEGETMNTLDEMGVSFVKLMAQLIAYVEDEKPTPDGQLRGRARLLHRLYDPDDTLDLDDLSDPFQHLMAVMFERPTGSPPESPSNPGGTSPESGDSLP